MVDNSGGNAFDYGLPENVAAQLQIGSRVRVPVRTRSVLGTIIELRESTEAEGVKPISDVISAEPIVGPLLIRLAAWIADYYCCSIEAAMRSVLPNVIRKAEIGHRQRLTARLTREVTPEELEALRRKAPLQAGVIAFLAGKREPVLVTELAEECDASHAVVQALVKRTLVITEPVTLERDPFDRETFVEQKPLTLNPEQIAVFAPVRAAIEAGRALDKPEAPKPILLHGVTGSGKTEIYLQAIQLVLERGQSAIMLVPEISLTPQTVERFKSALRRDAARSRRAAQPPERRRAARRMARDSRRPRADRDRRALRDLRAVRRISG